MLLNQYSRTSLEMTLLQAILLQNPILIHTCPQWFYGTELLLSALLVRINSGDYDLIFAMLGLGIADIDFHRDSPKQKLSNTGELLPWGVFTRNPEVVRKLMDVGAPIDGYAKLALLKWGVQIPNQRQSYLNLVRRSKSYTLTALQLAAGMGFTDMVEILLGAGFNINASAASHRGRTALQAAAENGREAIVRQLLDTGKVEVDSRDNDGRTPLSWAATNGQEATLKQLLHTGKVDVDSRDNDGRTPLSWAAMNGHRKTAMSLLKKAFTHGVAGAAGVANNNGVVKLTSIQSLPDYSSDVFGRKPYMWAALGGHMALIQSLWPSHLPISSSNRTETDHLGLSLIHFFAIGNCADGVSLMLDAGSDVNETDSQAWTPLHWAAYFGHRDVADALLCRNADTSLVESKGWTPYELSIFVGDSVMAQSLKDSAKALCSIDFQKAQPLRGQCDACGRVSHAQILCTQHTY
jgi:ankyrin repeat protein